MAEFDRAELHRRMDAILDTGLTGQVLIHVKDGEGRELVITTRVTPNTDPPSRKRVSVNWGNGSHEDE